MTTTTGAGRDPRTDRGRRTRQALVAAARVVFEDKGFAATRMGDIAEQAGVSHGTVYTYFDTKEELLAASVQQLVADMRESIRTAESANPVERVWIANHRYLTAYLSHASLMRVVEEAGAANPQFAEIVADLRRTHADRVAGQIRKLQATDLISTRIEPEAASRALCAMVEGFARNWTEHVNSDPVGSTRSLTQLWVNSLGINSLGIESLGVEAGPTSESGDLSAAGAGPRERAEPESSKTQYRIAQPSRLPASVAEQTSTQSGTEQSGTAQSGTGQAGTAQSGTAQARTTQEPGTKQLEAHDAVHTRT